MNKKKLKKIVNKIPYIIIILLIISNIYFINKGNKEEQSTVEEIVFYQKETKENYNEKKKYYQTINYSKFNTMSKKNEVYTFAIVDSTSNTYNSFMTLINQVTYYKGMKIFVLDISELSKKNNVAFLDIDERLSDLESNYLITTKKKKIISLTEIESSAIGALVKETEQ
jgi:uncharacterized protein YxeA